MSKQRKQVERPKRADVQEKAKMRGPVAPPGPRGGELAQGQSVQVLVLGPELW